MQTIVKDINNGKEINKIFIKWLNIKTAKQHSKVMNLIVSKKFGTYKQFNILEIIKKIGGGSASAVAKLSFFKEVQEAIKKNK